MKSKLFFVFVVIISCNSSQKSLFGTYTSKKETKLERLFSSYDYWAVGSILNLEKDSTFCMKNCGNILEGRWKKRKDSLLLYVYSNNYVIDSLNEIPEWKKKLNINSSKPFYYIIKRNILYNKSYSKDSIGEYTSLMQKLIRNK